PKRTEFESYTLVSGTVFGSRSDYSRPYLSGLYREMRRFRPGIIHVFNEATSHIVLQTVLYRNWFLPSAKVVAFGLENLFPSDLPDGNRFRALRWAVLNQGLDGVAYANTEGMNRLRELGLSRPRMKHTYWGVPLEQYSRCDPRDLRRDLGLQGKTVL